MGIFWIPCVNTCNMGLIMEPMQIQITKLYGTIKGLQYTKKHFSHTLKPYEIENIDLQIKQNQNRMNWLIDIYNTNAIYKINTND